jgi:TonB-linked SusC/RagA family outer membrane protein
MKQNLRKISRSLLTLMLVLMVCGKLFAQNLAVRGIVLDNNNQPLPGVSVTIKGGTGGTVTSVEGRFTMSVAKGETLVFKSIGFVAQELVISEPYVSVTLQPDTKTLTEVVVTALGVKKEFQKLGYSQSVINGDDLTEARDANPLQSMEGKVAGLSIGSSSEFFGAPTVVLRGSQDILYVIDGEPVESNTYDFNADDIDTYTILKGPNAAALYGFRGINGAIIITTKKGTKEKKGFEVTLNSVLEAEKGFIVLPKAQYLYGRGTNYFYGADVNGQSAGYGDITTDPPGSNPLYDNFQRLPEWGPQFDGQPMRQFDSPYNAVTGIRSQTPWLARGVDNWNNFVQTGYTNTNSVAVAASGSNYNIRMSYGHTFQQGDFPNTKLNIDNFKISAGYELTPKLRIDGDLNLNEQYSPNIPDVTYGPNSYAYEFFVYGSSDYPINELKNIYQGPQGVPNLVQYAQEYGRENNPYFQAEKWLKGRTDQVINGSLALTYKFTNEFDIRLRSALNTYNEQNTEDVPSSTNLNDYLPWYSFGWYGDYRQDDRNLLENNTDLTLNYKTKIAKDFNFNILGGANERSFRYLSDWATTKDLSLPNVYTLANTQNQGYDYNFNSKMQVYSAYYSFDIGYKNYLNINTTGRVDNLSTLPSGSNTFFYPSVSASSVVNDYVKLPEFISFFKLRASYADVKGGLTSPLIGSSYNAVQSTALGTGWNSQPVSNLLGYGTELYTPYNGPSYLNSSSNGPATYYNSTPSVNLSNTVANANIKPYDVKSIEFGADLKFLGNRLGLNATYFSTTNGPNIISLALPPSTTNTSQIINGVTTQKNGVEIELVGSPLRSKDGLNWDINANWSTYRETLKSVYDGAQSIFLNGHVYNIGDRMDAEYGTKFVRDANGNIINNASGAPLSAPSDPTDKYYGLLGYADPDFSFGITNRFTYKNWSLSFQFDGRIGGKIYDDTYYHSMNGGTAVETTEGAYGVARNADWVAINTTGKLPNGGNGSYLGPGVQIASGTPQFGPGGVITNLSQLTFTPNKGYQTVQGYVSSDLGANFDEYYMISRSFAKLREATIGYTVPASALQGTFIKKISINIVGRNLLYFAARKDIDLDEYASGYNNSTQQITGTDNGNANLASPTARRYGLNLHLTF